MDEQRVRQKGDHRDWREILGGVVVELRVQARSHRERAHVEQDQRVADCGA